MAGYGTMFWGGEDILPIDVTVYSNEIRNYDTDTELNYYIDINKHIILRYLFNGILYCFFQA